MNLFTKTFVFVILWLCQLINTNTAYTLENYKLSQASQFPYQVMLIGKYYPSGRILCGGALISNEWILTASHCIDDTYEIIAHLGATDYNNELDDGRIVLRSNKYIMHEKYDPSTAANDIALVKIRQIEFSNNIQPVKLPRNYAEQSLYGRKAIVSGWGTNSAFSSDTNDMQYYEFKVITNRVCIKYYSKSIIRDSILCATGESSLCLGDSGGPLVLKNSLTLIGIVSFGPANGCKFGIPSGFTRVSHYLDWIRSKTGVQ